MVKVFGNDASKILDEGWLVNTASKIVTYVLVVWMVCEVYVYEHFPRDVEYDCEIDEFLMMPDRIFLLAAINTILLWGTAIGSL